MYMYILYIYRTPSPGQRGCAYKGEVVPATPPGSEHTEPGDSKLVSTGSVRIQDYIIVL